MINPDYDLISKNFHIRLYDRNSDSTYILRMMLFRAASEADRRYYLNAGEKAKEYRRLSYELDELAHDIEHYLDETGQIKPKYLTLMFEALILARYLILLDQWETDILYENLMMNLVYPRKNGWPVDLAA